MSHKDRLPRRGSSAANQVLCLLFDPEMRWTVGKVSKNRYHRSLRSCLHRVGLSQAFQNRVIEIGNHRDHKVGLRVLPMARQQLDNRRLELPNQHLHYPQHRTGADGKTVFELRIVEVFHANAGEVSDHVGRFEQVAQVDWIDLPRTMLLFSRRYQCSCRSAVSTTRVEVDQVELCVRVIRRFGAISCHESAPSDIGSETEMFGCEPLQRMTCTVPSCSSTAAVRFCT